jgi:hypothetical protein
MNNYLVYILFLNIFKNKYYYRKFNFYFVNFFLLIYFKIFINKNEKLNLISFIFLI